MRTRSQTVWLSAECELKVPKIAAIVRESDDTVARWFKRYLAGGLEGLKDAPRPGRPSEITEEGGETYPDVADSLGGEGLFAP
jgi:transposase